MTAVDAPPQDLLDPAWWVDLERVHEFFTWARREAPVYRDANGYWILTRHADVLDAERRSAVFSSKGAYRVNQGVEETNMIAQDDPEHLALRRLVSGRFTPRAVHDHDEFLQSRIDEILDDATPTGQVEVVHAVAAQLPSRLTAELLGFPEARWEDIKSWSERLMRTDAIFRDSDAMAGMMSAIMEFNPALEAIAAERRECPAHDLISVWTEAGLDPMSMMHETGLFIAGGAETTRTVIARGLAILAEHPDQWDAAAADPTLIPGLVEEIIRWVTPLNNMFRIVVTDDVIGGQAVAAGERIMMAYPSANRDEDVFDDPFRFDIRRDPNHHLAFGNGTHFCVGANLARLELRMLFGSLTQRWTNLRIVTPPDIEPNVFAGAVRRFDLAFDPAMSHQGVNEVGDGLWAYLQLEPGWGWSNAGLIGDGDASLLVDTLFDLHLTARMLDALGAVSPAPIGTVVNTHANGDHCYGNQLVAGADIVTSAASAAEMDEVPPSLMAAMMRGADGMGATGEFLREIFGGFDFEGIEHVPPTTTFDGSLTLTVGDRVVELLELGPAHTAGDVIVHVPDAGVLYAGDLIFHGIQPIVWAGPVQRWIDACDRMLALEPAVVVPGHGPLSDTACIREQRAYFEWLVAEGTPRLQGGMSCLDTARELATLGEAEWGEGSRLIVNVTALARDLGLEPKDDVMTMFGGMAELSG